MALPSTSDQYPTGEIYGETVQVAVGKAPGPVRSFSAHKSVLRFYSGYFRGALNKQFSENRNGHVNLPTEDPDTFRVFLDWIYSRRLTFDADKLSKDNFISTLFKVWVFADAHAVPLLQNETLELLHRKTIEHWVVDSQWLHYLYENTTPNSQLRRYYVKVLASTSVAASQFTGKKMSWPKEATEDVLEQVWYHDRKCVSKEELLSWETCDFHVHEPGVQCRTQCTTQ